MKINVRNGFIRVGGIEKGERIEFSYGFVPRASALGNSDIPDDALRKILVGPLLQAYDGREIPLIDAPAEIHAIARSRYRVDGTETLFTPLYHLLDPAVSHENHYHRGVLVRQTK